MEKRLKNQQLLLRRPIVGFSMKKGFTLIELLVVISLIGILMGILLVSFQGTRRSARDGRRKADLEQIRSALEICRTDTGSYPVGSSLPGTCSAYLPSVPPTDPLYPTYQYPYSGAANTYTLCAYLEGGGIVFSCTGNGNCGSCTGATCNYKVCNP